MKYIAALEKVMCLPWKVCFLLCKKPMRPYFFLCYPLFYLLKVLMMIVVLFSRSLDIWVIHYVEVYLEVMQEN